MDHQDPNRRNPEGDIVTTESAHKSVPAEVASAVTQGSRRLRIALVGGAIALLAGSLAFVARDGDSGGRPAATSTSSTTPALPEEIEVISVEGEPTTVAAGEEAIWVLTQEDTISRIDPVDNQVTATTDIGDADDRAVRLAAGEGALWITVRDESGEDDDAVLRIDPSTNEVVDRISVGLDPNGVSAAEGAVWVANSGDDTVSRIDPDTNQVTDTVGVGAEPVAVAVGEGAVWVANRNGRTVSRIDPAINEVTDTITVGNSPSGGGVVGPWDLAIGEGAVWVTASDFDDYTDGDGVLFRIDPEAAEVVGATSTCPAGSVCGDPSNWGGVGWPGTFPSGIAAGDGEPPRVWWRLQPLRRMERCQRTGSTPMSCASARCGWFSTMGTSTGRSGKRSARWPRSWARSLRRSGCGSARSSATPAAVLALPLMSWPS